MKIFPIKSSATIKEQANFKGKFYPYDGVRPYVLGHQDYHPDSSIEQVIGHAHENRTGNVYFADPMEQISDFVKKHSDYIVYDNEPAYPDVNEEVSKNYFGTERVNYRTQFERIRDYFYRREQGGWADKAEAQYQQWQAAECIRLYDNAGDLRYQKEKLEDNIVDKRMRNSQLKNSIALTEELIAQKHEELDALKSDIATQEAPGANIAGELAGLAATTALISDKKAEAKKLQGVIKNLKMRLGQLNKKLNGNLSEIEADIPKINEIKAKLIPLFDDLKNFYAKQGIKKF